MNVERKRPVGDRFRRIWMLVEEIAAKPGQRRAELAARFHLSERQIQADLNIIHHDMRLPLTRSSGYRFVAEGGATSGPHAMTLKDGLVAITALNKAMPAYRRGPVAALVAKLPYVFPPHMQPLMQLLTGDALLEPAHRSCYQPLAAAALNGRAVRLHYRADREPVTTERDPVVKPELLMPYRGEWYVVGERSVGRRTRTVMWPMGGVVAVTLAAEGSKS